MSRFLPEPKVKVSNRRVKATSLALDPESVAWLDEVAAATGRSRSNTAREIFRKVRASETTGRQAGDRRKAS